MIVREVFLYRNVQVWGPEGYNNAGKQPDDYRQVGGSVCHYLYPAETPDMGGDQKLQIRCIILN